MKWDGENQIDVTFIASNSPISEQKNKFCKAGFGEDNGKQNFWIDNLTLSNINTKKIMF